MSVLDDLMTASEELEEALRFAFLYDFEPQTDSGYIGKDDVEQYFKSVAAAWGVDLDTGRSLLGEIEPMIIRADGTSAIVECSVFETTGGKAIPIVGPTAHSVAAEAAAKLRGYVGLSDSAETPGWLYRPVDNGGNEIELYWEGDHCRLEEVKINKTEAAKLLAKLYRERELIRVGLEDFPEQALRAVRVQQKPLALLKLMWGVPSIPKQELCPAVWEEYPSNDDTVRTVVRRANEALEKIRSDRTISIRGDAIYWNEFQKTPGSAP